MVHNVTQWELESIYETTDNFLSIVVCLCWEVVACEYELVAFKLLVIIAVSHPPSPPPPPPPTSWQYLRYHL